MSDQVCVCCIPPELFNRKTYLLDLLLLYTFYLNTIQICELLLKINYLLDVLKNKFNNYK